MHIEISYLVLSSKENVIIFYFDATAEQIEKRYILYWTTWLRITNCSILEIPDLFLVQYRKNQICLVYLPGHLYMAHQIKKTIANQCFTVDKLGLTDV